MEMTLEKNFIDALVKEREYELDGTQTYFLYDDKEQTTLLAMAYDEDGVVEQSKYYSSGVWFVCDNTVDSNVVLNERKYKKKIVFPDVPEERPTYLEIHEQYTLSSKMGDIR